jgi:prolipoprotein diacylglyceryltransferase
MPKGEVVTRPHNSELIKLPMRPAPKPKGKSGTRKPKPNGSTSGLFLLAYGVFRIIAEFARQPDPQLGFLTFGLTMGQILSIPMVIIGTILIIYAYKNNPVQGRF